MVTLQGRGAVKPIFKRTEQDSNGENAKDSKMSTCSSPTGYILNLATVNAWTSEEQFPEIDL
jgi:hypothetical protein